MSAVSIAEIDLSLTGMRTNVVMCKCRLARSYDLAWTSNLYAINGRFKRPNSFIPSTSLVWSGQSQSDTNASLVIQADLHGAVAGVVHRCFSHAR